MEKGSLYNEYKPLLLSIAYHMLGSVIEAEDIVHDVFLSWEENRLQQIRDPKAYLCRMVHNRCVNVIRSPGRNRETYVGPWLPEPVDAEFFHGDNPMDSIVWKESLSTAGLLLLQQLSANERIVFLLREVFHYPFDEIAEIVDKSNANCRQIFHRAKKSLGQLPERLSDDPVGSEQLASQRSKAMKNNTKVAERFAEGLMAGNINLLIELLSSDAVLYTDGGGKVKAALRPIVGADKIIRFFVGIAHELPPDYQCIQCEINGMPGVRMLTGEVTFAAITLQYTEAGLSNIYVVMNPEKLSYFNRANR